METQLHFRGNSAYWNSFKWGTIIPSESTFQVVPRSRKNIFKMFNGLGINEELLLVLQELDIKFIEFPFCGEILKTTTNKWLREGIKSPFCSDRVDQQIVLGLDKINLNESEPPPVITQTDKQLSLFGRLQYNCKNSNCLVVANKFLAYLCIVV